MTVGGEGKGKVGRGSEQRASRLANGGSKAHPHFSTHPETVLSVIGQLRNSIHGLKISPVVFAVFPLFFMTTSLVHLQ